MYEYGFWGECAEAMELANEGHRLIAKEIAEGVRSLWQRMMHWLEDSLHGLGQHHHLPPV
jgi:hypothetical protein